MSAQMAHKIKASSVSSAHLDIRYLNRVLQSNSMQVALFLIGGCTFTFVRGIISIHPSVLKTMVAPVVPLSYVAAAHAIYVIFGDKERVLVLWTLNLSVS